MGLESVMYICEGRSQLGVKLRLGLETVTSAAPFAESVCSEFWKPHVSGNGEVMGGGGYCDGFESPWNGALWYRRSEGASFPVSS